MSAGWGGGDATTLDHNLALARAALAVRLDPLVDRLAGEVHVYLWFVGD